jgi:hypothetical protein
VSKAVVKEILVFNVLINELSGFEKLISVYESLDLSLSPLVTISFASETTLALTDYVTMLKIIPIPLSEVLSVTSSASLPLTYPMTASENVIVSDALSKLIIKVLNTSESLRLSDAIQYLKVISKSLFELVTISSSSTLTRTISKSLSESLRTQSSASITRTRLLTASELLSVRDALSKKYVTYLSEVVIVSSNASFTMIISASENVRVNDSLNYVRGRFLTASESLTASDVVSKKLVKSLSETVNVSSSASIIAEEPGPWY